MSSSFEIDRFFKGGFNISEITCKIADINVHFSRKILKRFQYFLLNIVLTIAKLQINRPAKNKITCEIVMLIKKIYVYRKLHSVRNVLNDFN